MDTAPAPRSDGPAHGRGLILILAAVVGGTAGILASVVTIGIRDRAGGSHASGREMAPRGLLRDTQTGEQRSSATVELTGVNTADKLMTQLAVAMNLPVHPHWERMTIKPESPVRFDLPRADVRTVFRLLNSQRDSDFDGALDYRLYPDHAEVGTTKYFDLAEITVVNYDISSLVRSVQAAASQPPPPADLVARTVVDTIVSNVSFEDWYENGGELAKSNVIGSGLLISAPKRFHPQIEWVLAQIERTPGWTTGLQRLLAPGAAAAAGLAGAAGTPSAAQPGSAPPGGSTGN